MPDDATVVVVAGPKIDYLPPEVDAAPRATCRRGGKLLLLIDPPDKADAPPLTNLIALAQEWGIEVGNDLVVDASGLGQLIGADAAVPIAMPSNPPHAITSDFRPDDGVSARPIGHADRRRRRTARRRRSCSRPARRAGPRPTSRGCSRPASRQPDPDKGDKAGPDLDRRGRLGRRAATRRAGADAGRAEAGDARRRRRRQRLRVERRDQHPRQPRLS